MPDDTPWWPSRYGADDERGTLNELTPARIVAAARLVRTGRVYDLGRTLHADVPRFEGRFWRQTLVSSAHFINARRPGGSGGGWGANRLNWITELVTGTLQIGTQLDALNHLQIGDRFYNGWRAADIVEEWGTRKLGIETVPPVIARGVVVDVARRRGVPRLEAGDVITVDDVEGALRAQDTAVGPGDVVLFHTGWGALWDEDPGRFAAGEPGAGMAVAEWLVERRVAMTGADTWSFGPVPGEDPDRPFLVPQTLNVVHGLFIMENLATEALAADRISEFMFVLTHHKTRGSTAAIIAPAAVI
ncbi:MAG: cyclase family protein [Bacillati bacterium ANGP1]|uniref:Cyclase family protein n=1 Tax=Candidatus Segetimicrobium genomatis TaxID=2569760 RepID=A0A537K1G9_9BACT|nr:MAG: cyclase family protein [Terrabacteria group bacterium ANGP1]